MNPKPYYLQISAKTKFFNFFRKFFILSGTDKLLSQFTRHHTIDSFAAKLIPPNYLYTHGYKRSAVIDAINLQLDISDTIDHSNYFGIAEPAQVLLYSQIKPGMTIIDIGANIGATTLNFAKKTGSEGKVFSFEPGLYNFKRATENVSLNAFSNITLINQGLGDKKATAFLYNVNTYNRGMQRLLKEDASTYEKTAVDIDTLDSSIKNFSIPRPSLIKIDVEGYEYKVLQGATDTLTNYRPTLFIELDDNNLREQDSNAKQLISFILNLKYKIVNAATGVFIDNISAYDNCHFDILCTPE